MAVGRIVGGIAGLGLVGAGYVGLGGEDSTTRNEQGEITEGGELGAFRIRVGDCLGAATGEIIESVEGVPCSQPHDSEVYHAFMLPPGDFPGLDAVIDQAGAGCVAAFEPFVGAPYETSTYDINLIYPTEASWAELGDREVLCNVVNVDGSPLVGSAKGTAR
ncbi:MAG: septum formation family protein [Actinomycetota bacterium]